MNIKINLHGDLEFGPKQGVLLLNNTLTVRQSSPNSSFKNMEGFYTGNSYGTF